MLGIGIVLYLCLSYLIYGLFAWLEKRTFGMSRRYYRRNAK